MTSFSCSRHYFHFLKGDAMRVLVTGGTGFTGSALVLRLLGEGYEVRSLDYQKGILFDKLKEAGAELVLGSVTDTDVVRKAVEGVNVVFHLAAAFRELNVSENHYYDVNVNGTRNVIEAASKQNIMKFVYCSTQGVGGP
jgi:nucleoside-diphosphate-sugar epimerase